MTTSGYVFPCQPGKRVPRKGFKWKAAADNQKQWRPKAGENTAIAPDETFFVLDVDIKKGKPGKQSLKDLISRGLIGRTYTVQTPSGGLHLYYKLPEHAYGTLKNNVEFIPGLDIRCQGGYVIAAGGLLDEYPGKAYAIVDSHEFAMVTDGLLALLPKRDEDTLPLGNVPNYAQIDAQDASAPSAESLISTESASPLSTLPDTIPAGQRDDTLFRYACSWRERNYPMDHAQVLMEALHAKLEQPTDDHYPLSTALKTLKRAYKTYRPGEEREAQAAARLAEITPKPTSTTAQLEATIAQNDAPGRPEDVEDALTRFIHCADTNTVIDTLRHPAVSQLPFSSFSQAYANITFRLNPKSKKEIPLAQVWLQHPNRQSVDTVGYRPNAPAIFVEDQQVTYNRWRESELLGQAEAVKPSAEMIAPFFDHLDYLFGRDKRERELFWNWLAYSIRYPERRVAYGVLLIGQVGVGKSWFYNLLKRIVGVHDVNTVSSQELLSEFNSWVHSCSFVLVHELLMSNNAKAMENVKSMITEDRVMINEKSVRRKMMNIYASFLCFSNHANAAALSEYDRRFFVYRSAAQKASEDYYAQLWAWLDTDGPLHLVHHIMAMDLSGFKPSAAPMDTSAKRDMIYDNMPLIEQMMREAHRDHLGPFGVDVVDNTNITEWLEMKLNKDLDDKDKRCVQRVLSDMQQQPLPQNRYRVPGQDGQLRLKCIRNWSTWHDAPPDKIVEEYMRLNTRPNLKVVE